VDDGTLQYWIDEIVRIDQALAGQARQDALNNPGGYDAKKYDESTIEFGKVAAGLRPRQSGAVGRQARRGGRPPEALLAKRNRVLQEVHLAVFG
jgi:hypothetical protein